MTVNTSQNFKLGRLKKRSEFLHVNAVVRNRAKRRLREIARALLPKMGQKGMDYVFIARDSTVSRPYEALLDDARAALLSLRA